MQLSDGLLAGETEYGTCIMKHIRTPKQRAKWLALRAQGVSASEISSILGLNPYGDTALDLWLQKKGMVPPKDETLDMWLGTELETTIAKRFTMETGLKVKKTGLWRSKARPHMMCSPDFIVEGKPWLVECKFTGVTMAKHWEDDQTSDHAELQALGQIDVTGAEMVYVCALVAGYRKSFEIREVKRNDTIVSVIHVAADKFMHHLHTDTAPEVTERDDSARVDLAYPLLEGKRRELDQDTQILLDQYVAAKSTATKHRREMDAADKLSKVLFNRIKERQGGAEVATIAGVPVAHIMEVPRAGYTVAPSTYTRLRIIK